MDSALIEKEIGTQQSMSSRFTNWLLGLLTLICVGCFTFLWHVSEDLAIMKDHDTQKTSAMDRLQNDVNQLRAEVQTVNTNNAILTNTVNEIKVNQISKH